MKSRNGGLRKSRRQAFTLVELLVVIAIIGILVALLLPAVQAAREAARRTQCVNHLKNLSLGCMNHESAHKFFPSGGWGINWVGDPDRGTGEKQPGSWFYSVLPFIEEQALHDMPKDGQADGPFSQQQLLGARAMVFLPAPAMFHCPSRRPAIPYKVESHHPEIAKNSKKNEIAGDYYVGSNDYAANGGDGTYLSQDGPATWQEGNNQSITAVWTARCDNLGVKTENDNVTRTRFFTGIVFLRSEVGIRHIEDGASKTYLIGERFMNSKYYDREQVDSAGKPFIDGGDNWGWAWGFDDDSIRSGFRVPVVDNEVLTSKEIFGSAHPGGWHAAFADGHVESISYDIDLLVHQNNADRGDSGQTAVQQ